MPKTNKSKLDKSTDLVAKEPINSSIVMPAVSPEQAVKSWQEYQDLKAKIVDKEKDIQVIGDEEFLKKSYWRKLGTFFNLTTRIISETHEKIGSTYVWHFTVEAIAPNGRTAIGTGSCDMFEKATYDQQSKSYKNKWGKPATPNSLHNIRTTAETRATNRAISNLVGGGEVSAEEVDQRAEDTPKPDNQNATQQTQPSSAHKSFKPKQTQQKNNIEDKIQQQGENYIIYQNGKIIPKEGKPVEISGIQWWFNKGVSAKGPWASFTNVDNKDEIYWHNTPEFAELINLFKLEIEQENGIVDPDDIPDFV